MAANVVGTPVDNWYPGKHLQNIRSGSPVYDFDIFERVRRKVRARRRVKKATLEDRVDACLLTYKVDNTVNVRLEPPKKTHLAKLLLFLSPVYLFAVLVVTGPFFVIAVPLGILAVVFISAFTVIVLVLVIVYVSSAGLDTKVADEKKRSYMTVNRKFLTVRTVRDGVTVVNRFRTGDIGWISKTSMAEILREPPEVADLREMYARPHVLCHWNASFDHLYRVRLGRVYGINYHGYPARRQTGLDALVNPQARGMNAIYSNEIVLDIPDLDAFLDILRMCRYEARARERQVLDRPHSTSSS